MIRFLKMLRKTVEMFPDRVAVVDRDGTRSTTYRQLYDQAARVNHWMKAHDIGKESVAAIYFNKGAEYIATRLGVIMAGAAWVGLEDMMGSARIQYVIRDCGCKAVFDMHLWEEAMQLEPSYEFADPDDHDLAFFIYTSGSTGEPKGAANEYGIYDLIMEGVNGFVGPYAFPDGRDGEPVPVQFAHVLPETFVGGVYITVGILDAQSTIHVISPELTRDLKQLIRYFVEHKIDTTFMTPTFLNLAKTIPELSLRAAYTGGEIVSAVFSDRFDIVNIYGTSEFGYPVCLFTLDRQYDTTPIGYPVGDTDFRLIDENGNESDEGELIVYLPWFRGYHHLPEENERANFLLNGKKYFRSKDIARRDEKGCFTILGRADDMIKINGNRVDPSETEKAMKEAFGLDFCVVRQVKQGDRAFLCTWYTGDTVPEPEHATAILSEHLPYYMIPSYYMHIDEIPLNANGKVDKRALPDPVIDGHTHPVTVPESRNEKILSEMLERILKTGRTVGIDEDFFELGGDSIYAMQIVSEDILPGLDISMIYEGRTVRKICALYEERNTKANNRKSDEDLHLQAPLNKSQEYLIEYEHKYPDSTMLNLPIRFSLREDVDLQRLADVVKEVIRKHPALLSTIELSGDGRYIQRYVPEFDQDFPVEKVTDKELEEICSIFVKPFRLDGSPMMRCRILEGDTEKVLLFDVYHGICDGWSLNQIFEDVGRILAGQSLPKDYCFDLLLEEAHRKDSLPWQKDMKYFQDRYDRENYDTLPKPDHVTDNSESIYLTRLFDFSREAAERVCRRFRLGKNGLYLLASAMAIAEYNGTEDVLISWTWNGRTDFRTRHSVGVFYKDLPASFHIENDSNILSLLNDTRRQIEEGIAHGHASYFMESEKYSDKDLLCLIFQGDLYWYEPDAIVTNVEMMDRGDFASSTSLDVEILESDDEYGVMLEYNGAMYEEASMERFAGLICQKCAEIISVCEKR